MFRQHLLDIMAMEIKRQNDHTAKIALQYHINFPSYTGQFFNPDAAQIKMALLNLYSRNYMLCRKTETAQAICLHSSTPDLQSKINQPFHAIDFVLFLKNHKDIECVSKILSQTFMTQSKIVESQCQSHTNVIFLEKQDIETLEAFANKTKDRFEKGNILSCQQNGGVTYQLKMKFDGHNLSMLWPTIYTYLASQEMNLFPRQTVKLIRQDIKEDQEKTVTLVFKVSPFRTSFQEVYSAPQDQSSLIKLYLKSLLMEKENRSIRDIMAIIPFTALPNPIPNFNQLVNRLLDGNMKEQQQQCEETMYYQIKLGNAITCWEDFNNAFPNVDNDVHHKMERKIKQLRSRSPTVQPKFISIFTYEIQEEEDQQFRQRARQSTMYQSLYTSAHLSQQICPIEGQ